MKIFDESINQIYNEEIIKPFNESILKNDKHVAYDEGAVDSIKKLVGSIKKFVSKLINKKSKEVDGRFPLMDSNFNLTTTSDITRDIIVERLQQELSDKGYDKTEYTFRAVKRRTLDGGLIKWRISFRYTPQAIIQGTD